MCFELCLAAHAASGRGHGDQTLQIDRLGAIDAGSVSSVIETDQCCAYICKFIAIALHLGILHRCSLALARLIFQIVDFPHIRACRRFSSFFLRVNFGEQLGLSPN